MAFFDEVKKGLTDVSESIVKKSTELVEVQKLKMKKTSLESDIKRDFALLGKLYFAKMEADGTEGETPEAISSYERIVSAKQAVEEVKEKLSKINHEKNCRACGAKVPLDTIYCPKCGTRFEDEACEETCADEAEAEASAEADASGESGEDVKEESCGDVKESEDCGCEAEEVQEESAQDEKEAACGSEETAEDKADK